MTWNKHVNHISMKIARSIGILYRLRNIYPESVLLTIYNTLILPHFHYCLLLWRSVVKENHSLHLLQKKALRIITNNDYLAHTELGYESADLTVHPPPPQNCRGWVHFLYRCLVFPKNVLKGKPEYFGVIEV